MTAEISKYIEQIRLKLNSLHESLEQERNQARSLSEEVNRLNSELLHFQHKVQLQHTEMEALKSELAEKREQVQAPVSPSDSQKVDPAEIDVLVKEIDFCIQQLKTANG